MSVTPEELAEEKKALNKRNETASRRRRIGISLGILVLVVGLVVPFVNPQWSWGSIGTALALITVIMVFVRDYILDVTWTPKQSDLVGAKLRWRIAATFMYSVAVPVIVLAGIYQIIGNPVMELKVPRDRLAWLDPATGEQQLDGPSLNAFRDKTESGLAKIDGFLPSLWYPELLVVNCSTVRDDKCICPQEYLPVPDDKGLWDLNAGVIGKDVHGVRLCYRKGSYPPPGKPGQP